MELDKGLHLISEFNSDLIIDRVEWIAVTLETLTEMDGKYAKKFLIINKHLERKILHPEFLSLFKSYPVGDDRLTQLLAVYKADYVDIMTNEVNDFKQGAMNIKVYLNMKISLLLLLDIARDNVIMIDKLVLGMALADKEKLGYDTIPTLAELIKRVDRIDKARTLETAAMNHMTMADLVKENKELKEAHANFVNYEGRGRRGRGRGRGSRHPNGGARGGRVNQNNNNNNNNNGQNNNNNNNNGAINSDGNMVCIRCNSNKAAVGFRNCPECYAKWKKAKGGSHNNIDGPLPPYEAYPYQHTNMHGQIIVKEQKPVVPPNAQPVDDDAYYRQNGYYYHFENGDTNEIGPNELNYWDDPYALLKNGDDPWYDAEEYFNHLENGIGPNEHDHFSAMNAVHSPDDGIVIQFSNKTKYLSIECILGKRERERRSR